MAEIVAFIGKMPIRESHEVVLTCQLLWYWMCRSEILWKFAGPPEPMAELSEVRPWGGRGATLYLCQSKIFGRLASQSASDVENRFCLMELERFRAAEQNCANRKTNVTHCCLIERSNSRKRPPHPRGYSITFANPTSLLHPSKQPSGSNCFDWLMDNKSQSPRTRATGEWSISVMV